VANSARAWGPGRPGRRRARCARGCAGRRSAGGAKREVGAMAVVFAELKNTAGHAHPGHQSPAVHHLDTFRAALWHRGVTANSAACHGELKNDGGGEAIGLRGISSHSCGCAHGLYDNRRAAVDRERNRGGGRQDSRAAARTKTEGTERSVRCGNLGGSIWRRTVMTSVLVPSRRPCEGTGSSAPDRVEVGGAVEFQVRLCC